ncbi:MAG: hypothetical protein RIR33_3320 [Pseudomonadota bacterium]
MAAFKLNVADLVFVLKQIKIAEAHSGGTPLTEIWVDANGNVVPAGTPGATLAIPSPMAPFGLRTVDGSFNNIMPGRELWGAADQAMPRVLPSYYRNETDAETFDANGPGPGGLVTNNNYGNNGSVVDSDPRTISNLVADQSFNNPAAIVAALTYAEFYGEFSGEIYGAGGALETIQAAFAAMHVVLDNPASTPAQEAAAEAAFDAVIAGFGIERDGNSILVPNIAPDEGLSVPFNAWMTFFGQFFDHGLDLINKGGNGTVWVPLQADDPLMTHGADGIANTGDELNLPQNAHLAFMALTRATPAGDTEVNQTTPFVDQNQTYTSNASHQAFLREYKLVEGRPLATGHLLDGSDGSETVSSLPTWADVKAQALNMLGIELTDLDVGNVPVLRMDPYGEFVRGPDRGMPMILAAFDVDGAPIWVETDLADPINPSAIQLPVGTVLFGGNVIGAGETVSAARTGHAFLDDIAHTAAPVVSGGVLQTDDDSLVGNAVAINPTTGQRLEYDDELLDQHYITGDGRGNENIGLTAVHHVFHSEHNRQVEQQKLTILASGDEAFINEWLAVDVDFTGAEIAAMQTMSLQDLTAVANTLSWDGERLFQAARMATEMQYQHLVFEEFARKIQPAIDPFVFNSTPDINPAIFAEFAHVVYRFGHSMLTDNMPRIGGDGAEIPAMAADGSPLTAEQFGLVASFLNPIAFDNNGGLTDDQGAAAVIRGMTIERGSEIDEFLVDALRNNLLGIPLDLAVLNIARGRDTGMPSLNQARQALFDASGSTFLEPYKNWVDFAANLKHPISVVNFIAAYGTHSSITSATSAADKREAAWLLVFGGDGAPADRMDFLNATGAYTNKGGLNEVDLWIGGLAEKKMPFGGFLGSTFNAVFELQLENLQDGDRFYYLTRTQGQNFLVSLEQNSFAKMMMANTDLAKPGADGIRGTPDDVIERHIGVDSFGVYDFVLEVNVANQADYNTADPAAIAAAQAAVDAAQAALTAATAASDAADAAAATAAANLAAAQAAATSDAVALRATANTAQAAADALTTTAELGALLSAMVAANATDALALQAAAAAAQAVADATDADALQAAATQAAADDAAAAAAQAVADATDADALQTAATQAAADDAAAAAAQTLADATDADALQTAATQAAADDAALAAADAAAVLAAQAEADALAAFNSAQAALDLLIANSAPQVDIDAATVVRDDAQVALNSAELASDAADATAAAALAVANATDAGALQAAATQAAADDAAAAAALAVANATDAGALQAAATQAAADDAAAAAALAVANATDAGALQAAATQAAADDAAAAAAQAAATAAANADAALMVALNNYVTALAADQAADAAAATADAAADAAEAADAVEAAAAAAATAANNAAAGAAAAEAAALAALNQAQADLTAASTNPAGKDPVGNNPVLEAAGLGKVVRDDPNTAAVETNYIRVQGGEHVVVGGTNQNDTIITDFGDDGIWGDAGDDRIESGAGVDLVNGGSGNDVLTDSGDTGDFIKGDEGDDVIAGGNGLDIYMGGDGKDVIFHGVDDAETFAGQGDDFVLGGLGVDLIMGNEGDDWLEAGAGFDTTAGDNSELFFDSKIIGHDVMFSGSEEHDFDAESGDDIMVQGESVLRNEGMFGFDWVTYKGNPNAADVDLARPIFTTEVQDVLRDRFDKVEAASGYTGNDLLVGDDRIYDANANANVNATAEGVFFRDDINQAGIDRIAGLDQIITDREMFSGLYTSEFGDLKPGATAEKIFAGGNVLIGGAGSDTLIGKGGNDILDGDRWLNVRIRLTAPGDDNTAENELATIDSLTHVFTAPQLTALGIDTVHAGRSLSALLIDRLIVPSQMHIVREILDGGQNGDVDTAVFWDEVQNYTVTEEDDGSYIVTHNTVGNPLVLPPGFLRPISDGVDTLRNIELIRFGDGNGGFRTFNIADVVQRPATGAAVLTGDLTPIEGQTLTVSTAGISDPNGIAGFAFQWQSSVDGTTWVDIDGETGATLNIPDADGTALGALHGLNLRAVVTLTDNFGETQVFTTGSTARVGQNLDVSDSAVGVTFVMPDTDDVLTGSDLADNIRGFLGDDVLLGGDGDDLLLGGQGNDVVDGGAGIDTAGFGNGIANFTIAVAPGTTDLLIVNGVVSGADVVRNVEILQFNGQNYTVVMDNTDGASALNGGAGFQAIFGRTGNDTLDGGLNADLLVGGEGDDTILGGGGLDWIYQIGATDGRDFIDGGAGTDTYTLSGVAGAETFDIYTRTAYLTANPGAVLVGGTNTEIVITRNGSIIAELDNIEEIRVNSLLTTSQNGNGIVDGGVADGDTVNIIGDFNATSLLFNTIRVNGTDANDTVNIAGLESAHRVVFTTNGGSDTMLGAVRDQDIINGSVIDQRTTSVAAPMAAAAVASTSFGAFDGLDALVRSGLRGSLLDQSFGAADGLLGGAPGRVEFRTLGLDDLNIFSREAVDFTPMQQSVGRTMIDTHDLMPLDLADFGPAPAAVEIGSVHDAVTGFDYRSIGADFWVLP